MKMRVKQSRMVSRWTAPLAGVLAALMSNGAARGVEPATKPAAATAPATAPAMLVTEGLDSEGVLTLVAGKNKILHASAWIKTVNVGQADIVDAHTTTKPDEIVVNAKKPGNTQIMLFDGQGNSQMLDVTVLVDLSALQSQINKSFPGSFVQVESATNNSVVLKGRVPNLTVAQQVVQVATPYAPSIINLLEVSGGQQVVLQVRFAEVSRSITNNFGFNAFATDGVFRAGINNGPGVTPVGGLANGTSTSIDSTVSLFGAGQIGSTQFEVFLQALRTNGLLRTLAEPNLVAISGQEASFVAGGEFPYPVPQPGSGGAAITIEFKQYGIQLVFTPIVLGNGRIRLKVAPDVSELDYSNSVSISGSPVPGLTERKLQTEVELNEGQTFAVAGLLNNQVNATSNITPLLGDLPVIGALFRSIRYQRSETELVVLVTPHLADAVNPARVPTLPGEHWRFPNEVDLLWGHDLGGPTPDPRMLPPSARGKAAHAGLHGAYGFAPVASSDSK